MGDCNPNTPRNTNPFNFYSSSTAMTQATSDIGLIGLAVMGQNLALNIADHGFAISVYNRTVAKTHEFVAANTYLGAGLQGCEDLSSFVASLKRPRKVVIMVQAGAATDAVINQLTEVLEKGDIIIDGGNSKWTDTIRREKDLSSKGFHFVGSGVSGGEEGARFGPSVMPGGTREAWESLKPVWDAIAAKVDDQGREIRGATPGNPIVGGTPCSAYIGENGAGHYVKMVHNGIEYGDMQMICEAYALMRNLAWHEAQAEMAEVFANGTKGCSTASSSRSPPTFWATEGSRDRQTFRRHHPRHRRTKRHRQVDSGQRPRHGRARTHSRGSGVSPVASVHQGGTGGSFYKILVADAAFRAEQRRMVQRHS
jgi:6-phosphogluconate dehydrogenase (decarboxylating)